MSLSGNVVKHSSHKDFKIKSRNEEIEEVKDFKSLGLVVDPHVKSDEHVKTISKMVKTNWKRFKIIQHHISTLAACLSMRCMIFSHFSYYMMV